MKTPFAGLVKKAWRGRAGSLFCTSCKLLPTPRRPGAPHRDPCLRVAPSGGAKLVAPRWWLFSQLRQSGVPTRRRSVPSAPSLATTMLILTRLSSRSRPAMPLRHRRRPCRPFQHLASTSWATRSKRSNVPTCHSASSARSAIPWALPSSARQTKVAIPTLATPILVVSPSGSERAATRRGQVNREIDVPANGAPTATCAS